MRLLPRGFFGGTEPFVGRSPAKIEKIYCQYILSETVRQPLTKVKASGIGPVLPGLFSAFIIAVIDVSDDQPVVDKKAKALISKGMPDQDRV